MKHRISAGALIEYEGRLLLVRHLLPGRYDFWVAPGGGVEGTETLTQAAEREVLEETGLVVRAGAMLYIEEMHHPEQRFCKFWFAARCHEFNEPRVPKDAGEHIVQAQWFTREQLAGLQVFPLILRERYWADRVAGISSVQHLGLRAMDTW